MPTKPFPVLPPQGPYRLHKARVPLAMLGRPLPYHLAGPIQQSVGEQVEGLLTVDIDVDGAGNIRQVLPSACDVEIDGTGLTRSLEEHIPVIDVDGRVVITRLAEIHTHIDKSQTWERAPNHDGSYAGAKAGAKGDRKERWTYDDAYQRMSFALQCAYAHGTRVLRTHIDSQKKRTQPSWEVFKTLREEWAGRIELQGVVSLGAGKIMGKYGNRVAELAADHGAHLGPVIYNSDEQYAEINRSFELAERYELSLDFHVDETLDPTANGLAQIALIALERGFSRRIICGHVCALSMKDEEEVGEILALTRKAGIGIVSLPMANLYLQDRQANASPLFRGVAPMREIINAGIDLAIGSDNCRDAFHPYGDFNMIEVWREAARIGHLDNAIGQHADCVSATAEAMMGIKKPLHIASGHVGDMVLCSARSLSQLFARPGEHRQLICAGKPVDVQLPDFEYYE